jgi:hypothetical protein
MMLNRSHLACLAVALAALAPGAAAGAAPRCTVTGAERLPPASGGAAALCSAINRAAAVRGIRFPFTVQVRVGKNSMLMADVTLAGGARLATLHHAEMDRAIGRDSIDRFARAVAAHVAAGAR